MKRALSPRTLAAYKAALALAFPQTETICVEELDSAKIADWGNSALNQLKCACRWSRRQQGLPEKDVLLEDAIEKAQKYEISKRPYTPAELELEQLEHTANLLPPHERATVLFLLYTGLRAEEFYSLSRAQVERASQTNLLTFVRKGGREESLDVSHVSGLLDDFLLTPARGRGRSKLPPSGGAAARKWKTLGEIFSASGVPMSQYAVIRRLVGKTCKAAGLPQLSPHKLRHAFATRMSRDGANPFVIQAALGHRNITTTQRYISPSALDVAKFMRGPK